MPVKTSALLKPLTIVNTIRFRAENVGVPVIFNFVSFFINVIVAELYFKLRRAFKLGFLKEFSGESANSIRG